MSVMNAYYSHESAVGPVFDVARFSRFKSLVTAVIALGFSIVIGVCAAYVWDPDMIVSNPSEIWADAHQETKDLMRDHPTGTKIGVGIAAFFVLLCLVGVVSCFVNAISGNYYIRVGKGGISVRLPEALLTVYQRDIPWTDIVKITVVQEKRLGGTSRNDGNLGGELQIRTFDESRDLRLDHFREDAWLIHQRIQEARELQPTLANGQSAEDYSDDELLLATVEIHD